MSSFHAQFGKSNLQMPRLVFGATILGNLFVAPTDETKRELIRSWFHAVESPVAIDTAGKYGAGLSLEVIARELAAAEIDPKDVIISNKLAWRRIPLTTPEPLFEPGVWIDLQHDAVQDISYDGILRCHEDGKKILGPYTQQLISVHDPDEYLAAATDKDDRKKRMNDIVGAYQALVELRDAGEADAVGVGSKTWTTVRELGAHCDFDWVMMANTFTVMQHPPELVEFIESLAAKNIALINSALTHGGFLVGGRFLDYREINESDSGDQDRLQFRDRFTEICKSHNVSPYHVAVAFGCSHPAVNSVALSSSRPERTQSMLDCVSEPIDSTVWQSLREAGLILDSYTYV